MNSAHPLCLWKICDRVPDAHILGTIHALWTNIYPLMPHVEAVIDRAEIVMYEGGGLPYSEAMIQQATAAEPLERRLAKYPQLWVQLLARAKQYQIDLARWKYEPLFSIARQIDKAVLTQLAGPPVQGLDNYIREKTQFKVIIEHLETSDENIEHLVKLPASAQINMLRESLLGTATQDSDGEEAERAILAGDVETLARQIARDERQHPEYVAAGGRARNPAWARNIQRVLAFGKRTLIVGGAGHFAGEGNVLQLLKKQYGIRAIPIRS